MNFSYNTPIFNISSVQTSPIKFRATNNSTFVTPFGDGNIENHNQLYDYFLDKQEITQLAKSNPKIMNILKENNIRLNVNIEELEKLKTGHLMDTRVTSAKIYSALPPELKNNINPIELQEAAILHDYGKVLIPEKILKKQGELNPKEKKIMDLHSELGYELLKDQGVSKNVLNLVKYHHQTPDGTGYPEITDDFQPNTSLQIIHAADKYCALREERCYKQAYSKNEALEILKSDVENGIISQEIFDTLKKVV